MDSEILHGGEGGNVEWWLELRNNSFCFHCFIVSIYLFIIHLFLSINTHLNKIAIEHLKSQRNHEEKFRALHGESDFKSCFE